MTDWVSHFLPSAFAYWAIAALSGLLALGLVLARRSRHPRAADTISRRFEPATFLVLAFAAVLAAWVIVTLAFVYASPLLDLDRNVAGFAPQLWSPAVLRVATFVTALGGSPVITTLLFAATIWLAMRRRWALIAALWIAVLGDVRTVGYLKALFARPRPEFGYFIETSGSFPSGHAAISVAFFGTLAYVLWRTGRLGPVSAVLMAGVFALAIGGSRVLLIEHYVSDVLSGWLVGGFWMLVGVSVAEWWLRKFTRGEPARPSRGAIWTGRIIAASLVGMALWQTLAYDKAKNVQMIATPASSAGAPGL